MFLDVYDAIRYVKARVILIQYKSQLPLVMDAAENDFLSKWVDENTTIAVEPLSTGNEIGQIGL